MNCLMYFVGLKVILGCLKLDILPRDNILKLLELCNIYFFKL